MSHHAAHGISADLPPGWNGMIYRRRDEQQARASASGDPVAESGAILRTATVPLFRDDGDFGSGVVHRMGPLDAFMALVEYTVDEHLTPGEGLFESRGVPWPLRPGEVPPDVLLVSIQGQAGTQRFFTANDRPFCLYSVVGSVRGLAAQLSALNGLLGSIEIARRG